MSLPNYQILMLPLLRCAEFGNEVKTSDCVDLIAKQLNLTEEEISQPLPSGRQTIFNNRVHWARTYLAKAKVIESTKRGHFKITARGIEILKNNPLQIDNSFLSQFPEFVEWKNLNDNETNNKTIIDSQQVTESLATPEEDIAKSYALINAQLRSDLVEYLLNVSPSQFESIIIDLLIAMGYGGGRNEMGKSLGRSGDGGVDGIIKEDELGLDVVYIQAKRYDPSNIIGRPAIQSFAGSLEGFNATKGVFVTTSSFADTATEYVQRIHKRIILIDGKELANLMIRHDVGVRIKDVYKIKRIDEDYFAE